MFQAVGFDFFAPFWACLPQFGHESNSLLVGNQKSNLAMTWAPLVVQAFCGPLQGAYGSFGASLGSFGASLGALALVS